LCQEWSVAASRIEQLEGSLSGTQEVEVVRFTDGKRRRAFNTKVPKKEKPLATTKSVLAREHV